MCTYSMVVDWGVDKLTPYAWANTIHSNFDPSEEWKKQFLKDLMDLLKKAKKYDNDNGEPECELESKKEKLQAIADELGVEISFP